jgi:CheY-like chemotaxis protein
MPKLLATTLLSVSLAAGMFAAEGEPTAVNASVSSDQARELLIEGVKQYRTGRISEAAAAFREALKLNPENKQVYDFYLAAGDALLLRMSEYGQLDDVLKDVLVRARSYQQELRSSPAYIAILVGKLSGSDEERVVAATELAAIGPVAVPQLIAVLADNRQDDLRIAVRMTLGRMGYRAVLPLIAALSSSDERLVASIVTTLADIGDARALPYLLQLRDTATGELVKRLAGTAATTIAQRSGTDTSIDATQYFFQDALRYFRSDELVRDEMLANGGLVWSWNDHASEATQRLTSVRVPSYAWATHMADAVLHAGLVAHPNFPAFQPLLAAVYAAQDVDARQRASLATNADGNADATAAGIAALDLMPLRVRTLGGEAILRALQLAIACERPDVAVYLMRQLETGGLVAINSVLPVSNLGEKADDQNQEKAGSALVAALDSSDKLVRYQAAITLARLNPTVPFFNSDKVVPALTDAIGEWGMRSILVIDQDFRQRNVARELLQSKGYRTYTVTDGFDALRRLEEAPVKDAIIIAGDLVPNLRDSRGALIDAAEQKASTLVEQLRQDRRTENAPIIISLPDEPQLAARIKAAFDGKVAGFLRKPFNAQEIDDLLQASFKERPVANPTREAIEEVSVHAAQALAAIDVRNPLFDLGSAAETLVKSLPARSDAVRLPALQALGNAASGPQAEAIRALTPRVLDVYAADDAKLTPDLRAAFIYAIGQMDPASDAAFAALTAALASAQPTVRAAAAQALGHAANLSPAQRLRLQDALRAAVPTSSTTP